MAGEIPTDLLGILSAWGLPASAVALAVGLVKGADALEPTNPDRLEAISKLLKKGPLTSFGLLGAEVVPLVFGEVFGEKPFSRKFIARSIVASGLFWLILIGIKRFNIWWFRWWDLPVFVLPFVLFIDWISLVKAKYIINYMSRLRFIPFWTPVFVAIDLSVTYIIAKFSLSVMWATSSGEAVPPLKDYLRLPLNAYRSMIGPEYYVYVPPYVYDYITNPSPSIRDVLVTSTMLTSVWVLLFLLSSTIVGLLHSFETARRFTVWWFDIDAHPLTAIAKVAATLIVLGALALKAVRWGWLMV
jgi:hypothetical protein